MEKNSTENIYPSDTNGQSEDLHESEDTGNEDYIDDNNLESNLRRRKGKIISCAKETIESGVCYGGFAFCFIIIIIIT